MGGCSVGKVKGPKFYRILRAVSDRWGESVHLICSASTKIYFFQLPEALGLSFSSAEELNKIIDKKLPNGLPQFFREEVELEGQKFEFYHRDILQCV